LDGKSSIKEPLVSLPLSRPMQNSQHHSWEPNPWSHSKAWLHIHSSIIYIGPWLFFKLLLHEALNPNTLKGTTVQVCNHACTNSPLPAFEAQTGQTHRRWFWDSNHQTVHPWFWGQNWQTSRTLC
jgi:hypothetical protein